MKNQIKMKHKPNISVSTRRYGEMNRLNTQNHSVLYQFFATNRYKRRTLHRNIAKYYSVLTLTDKIQQAKLLRAQRA